MSQGPCLNPNCSSQGRPHPNCRCYAAMADGGPVTHYCESSKPHLEGCEYFAEGGMAFNPDEFLGSNQVPEPQSSHSGFNPDEFLQSPEADEYQQSKYGTGAQQAIAGVESIARSATFGLSSELEKNLGIPEKDQLGREHANPGTTMAGTVGGLFIPGGEGEALEKIGALAAERVVGQGVLKGAARGAVKLATENALFQAGDETSKMILHDPDQTVSTAIANVGLAGLLGGTVGGLAGATGALWKAKIEPKATEIVNDFKTRMGELKGEPVEPTAMRPEVPVEPGMPEPAPKTKQVYDPFVHAESTIESSISKDVPKAGFDPFTHQEIPVKETIPEIKPIETKPVADTLGGRLADFYVKRTDDLGAKVLGHGIGGTIGGYIGHLTGIPGAGAIGAVFGQKELGPMIEKIIPSIAKVMTEKAGSGSGLRAAVEYGMNVVKGEKLINNAAKNLFKPGGMAIPDSKIPDEVSRQKLDKVIQVVKQDPTKAINMAGDVGHYLPEHAAAMGSQAMQAVNFISSLKPQTPAKALLDKPIAVSQAVRSQYNRVLDIAEQPLMVLDAVKNGTITSHDVLALNMLYPQLYQKLKTQVMSQMVDHVAKGESVPYSTRMGLSLFLGEPLDSTFKPESISAAQPAPEQPEQQGKVQKVSQKASSNLIKGSKSLQTASQASEAMHQGGKA